MADIVWTPPDGWVEQTGAHVTFSAPCDCTNAGNLVIGSNTYSIVDALGLASTGIGGSFASGAIVDVILNCETNKAYIQNSAQADYVVEQGEHNPSTEISGRYVKWNSGRSEYYAKWVRSEQYNIAVSNGILYGGQYPHNFSYPSGLFTVAPVVSIRTWAQGYGSFAMITADNGVDSMGTASNSPRFRGIITTTAAVTSSLACVFDICAIGRWK